MMIAVIVAAIVIVGGVAAYVILSNNENTDEGPSEITLIDGRDKAVTIKSSSRVASTSATVTEIACGLGAVSKLAGVTNDTGIYDVKDYVIGIGNDDYPGAIVRGLGDKTITDLGKMYMISAESVLQAQPDLVIMGGYFNNPATIKTLEDMKIPVVVCKDDNSLANIYFNIRLIGKALGKDAEANELVGKMENVAGKIVKWAKDQGEPAKNVAVLMGFGSEWERMDAEQLTCWERRC